MESSPIPSQQIDGETVADFIFLGSKITADGDCSHEIKRRSFLGRKVMTNLDSILKSRDITLSTKVHLVKAMVFPVVMWELDYKESWAPKNWCFWTVVLEKTLESPLDCKEINQSIWKEISLGCSLEGLMLRLKFQSFGHLMWRWLICKDPDAGKDWGQEEKGMAEDEMVGWHHQLIGHGFGWTPEVGDGQGGLACCDSWGQTWLSNWTELNNTRAISVQLSLSSHKNEHHPKKFNEEWNAGNGFKTCYEGWDGKRNRVCKGG